MLESDFNYYFLKDAVNGSGTNQQDNSGNSCDLSSLDPLCNDSDELLRQLQENSFELESFFTEFTGGVDIKVKERKNIFHIHRCNLIVIIIGRKQ